MVAAALGALSMLVGVVEPPEVWTPYLNLSVSDVPVFNRAVDVNHCRYSGVSNSAVGGFVVRNAGDQDKLSIVLDGEPRRIVKFFANRSGDNVFTIWEGNTANVIDKFIDIEGAKTVRIRPETQVHRRIFERQFIWGHDIINLIYGKNANRGLVSDIGDAIACGSAERVAMVTSVNVV